MKNVIRLGDVTSHGGKVLSASGTVSVQGVKVARKGDLCGCPISGHAPCVIVEGDPHGAGWRHRGGLPRP